MLVRYMLVTTLLFLAGSRSMPAGVPEPATQAPPDWVAAYMADQIGVWIADNSEFKSETEAADAYGIEWRWGIGERSLVGRLYVIQDGRDVRTAWEFREFWHPGEKRLLASQFGADGTFGIGPHTRNPDGTLEMEQVFYGPDGSMTRIGHHSERRGDELITRSFTIAEDGTRTPRRTYVWKKVPAGRWP